MEGDIISIDGKTMGGIRHQAFDALPVVSAWLKAQGITLAVLESKGKSKEIKMAPDLWGFIDVKGTTVTTDTMSCQRDIAAKIQAKDGNYTL